MHSLLTPERMAKIHCLASGIKISDKAIAALAQKRGNNLIAFSEFPTTGGLTFSLAGAGYINAPFTGIFGVTPAFTVDHDGSAFRLRNNAEPEQTFPINILPLPSFIKPDGTRPFGAAMITHADRVRLSPVNGCAFSCGFCDLHLEEYEIFKKETLLEALNLAVQDPLLPARHALISGGTPRKKDRPILEAIYEYLLQKSPIPVDVMLSPRKNDISLIDKLVDWGLSGFALNVELFGKDARKKNIPQKAALGLDAYGNAIERAVELTDGKGRVRSLLVVGIEPITATLKGVEWLAQRGCNPVLSPLRPAERTQLAKHPIPSAQTLADLWLASREIAEKYGVKIGPTCVPCQHNDLSFPEP